MASFLVHVLRHNMHHVDLSVPQAGLPCSCVYPYVPDCSAREQREHLCDCHDRVIRARTSDWVKSKASALIVFNHVRHTTELMNTKNILHKSHSKMGNRRKVSVEVLFSLKMLLTLRQ